ALLIFILSFIFIHSHAQQAEPRLYSANSLPSATISKVASFAPNRPFPQHNSYQEGTILPDHVSQEEMDDSVKSFYQAWKKHYILPACREGESYVWFEGSHGSNICVSEGQGYGMVIVALMAGFDSSAQETFDRLYRFYKSHPSTTSPHLMAWTQKKDCISLDGGAATDGDMDIAYSLLLADAQWGRHSNIPYRQEALAMIDAIRHQEINPYTYIVMEDNTGRPRSKDYYDMRSSDFMPDHLRAFHEATGDPFWDTVITNNYRVFRYLQNTYSPEAGLVPDFIKNIHISQDRLGAGPGQVATEGKKNDTSFVTGAGVRTANSLNPRARSAGSTPPNAESSDYPGTGPFADGDPDDAHLFAQPVQPNYLESKFDGVYNFNACRVPWHVATDFLVSGDPRAAAFLTRINKWIQATTKGNPDNISAGYNLSGEDLPHRYFEALCFICPFAVAAMSSADNQEWLNRLWDYIQHFKMKNFDYYDNTIKMLTMIILSGNYWTPATSPGTFLASHSQPSSPVHQRQLPGSAAQDRSAR
ncbi:MAG TPA: glycosyl hydrolase family 8, partial [Puia sp.]|nr:glycosyl hydrolase family 8 [Puia sp.]